MEIDMSKAIRIQCEIDQHCALTAFRNGRECCVEASSATDVIPVWFSLDAAIEICDQLGDWIDEMKTEKRQQVRIEA